MQTYHQLLPLATGYFGVSSALYDFDGLVVIYGPAGGAWHINIEDEPRWYRGPATVVGAGILEMDVILGNENKFIDNIVRAASELKRRFVALTGTPISEIIGTDLRGLARMIETRTGLPTFMTPTAGSEPYSQGASKAFLALADKFMDPHAPKRPNGINVLGAVHLSLGKEAHVQPLLDGLEKEGFELVGVLSAPRPGGGDPLQGVRDAPGAALNLVVSASGVDLAERMYAQYGVPYVTGLPVGRYGWAVLQALLRGEEPPQAPAAPERTNLRHALVIGEPVMSEGVRCCLRHDFGVPAVDVVSVQPRGGLLQASEARRGSLMSSGPADAETDDEQEIAALMNAPDVDCVVADPCYRPLLEEGAAARFIPLPHIAMSARIHWDLPYEYALEAGYRYVAEQLA
jgi:hypothetical protein